MKDMLLIQFLLLLEVERISKKLLIVLRFIDNLLLKYYYIGLTCRL